MCRNFWIDRVSQWGGMVVKKEKKKGEGYNLKARYQRTGMGNHRLPIRETGAGVDNQMHTTHGTNQAGPYATQHQPRKSAGTTPTWNNHNLTGLNPTR